MALLAVLITFTALGTTTFADYYTNYTTLYEGMSSGEVVNLQNDLKSLGYFNYTSTGYFGSLTEQSVISFQKDNYLAADGIVGHATARTIKVDLITSSSKNYLGVPYVWGGTSPSGFDCSGFIYYVFLNNGIAIPRTTDLQYYNAGTWVSYNNLEPGDLVFFTTYAPGPSHVGMYLGNGQFIQASSSKGVTISDLSNSYFSARYIGAKRIIQ